MMANYRIANLGDSVPWGQGLNEPDKYDLNVQRILEGQYASVTLTRCAHSGAVINDHGHGDGPAQGEVPVSLPTILTQCESFDASAAEVDLVLINGGINDVGVSTILNPFAVVPPLAAKVHSACHDNMLTLLEHVTAKFTKASCRILVTGYYIIISEQSDPLGVRRLLSSHGIAPPPFLSDDDLLEPLVKRCSDFFKDSTNELRSAVADAGDPRITFVPSGFTEANAVFVPTTSLLWGLELDDDLDPEDPVAAARHAQCDITFGSAIDILPRQQCYRASAGHPNPAGARQFLSQILAALGLTPQ